ncbi:MAG: hypothetical protein K5753_04220, partial [Clostridia bacterium]|nr:hypothetical protein [Clostridia bacterium]
WRNSFFPRCRTLPCEQTLKKPLLPNLNAFASALFSFTYGGENFFEENRTLPHNNAVYNHKVDLSISQAIFSEILKKRSKTPILGSFFERPIFPK